MTLSTGTRSKGQRVLRRCVGMIPPVQMGVMLAANCPITIKQVTTKKNKIKYFSLPVAVKFSESATFMDHDTGPQVSC